MSFEGAAGLAYALERSADLVSWDRLPGEVAAGGGGERLKLADAGAAGRAAAFYRVLAFRR